MSVCHVCLYTARTLDYIKVPDSVKSSRLEIKRLW